MHTYKHDGGADRIQIDQVYLSEAGQEMTFDLNPKRADDVKGVSVLVCVCFSVLRARALPLPSPDALREGARVLGQMRTGTPSPLPSRALPLPSPYAFALAQPTLACSLSRE